MIEKPTHIEAFEHYYSSGDKRSYKSTASRFNVSKKTIERWSNIFHWIQRVEQRDIENSKALQDKLKPETNKIIVNTKADYRAEIKQQLNILKAVLNQAIKDIKEGKFASIDDIGDLKDVVNSYEKLCNLDLKLMSEATEIYEQKGFEELDRKLALLTLDELKKISKANDNR